MSKTSSWKKYTILIGVLFLFPLSLLLLLGPGGKHNFVSVPYHGPVEVMNGDTAYYSLPDYILTDQDGKPVSISSLRGKFWLAAFFTVSDSNLTRISRRLLYYNDRYIDQPDIEIVCFDISPGKSSLEEMRTFIERIPTYDGTLRKIRFLTSTPERMDSVLKSFLIEDISNEGIFRLVDNDGHLRGIYGNTEYHMADAIDDTGMIKKQHDKQQANERKRDNRDR